MGNELNNGGKLKENTDLSLYIKDFILNKHNFKNDDKFKNYLKKRACCTNNAEVPISLPTYDITTKQVYPMNLKVKVLPQVTKELCNIDNEVYYTTGTGPYRQDGTYNISSTCKNFYTDFCENVYQNRANYTDSYKKLYGPYEDNITNITNPTLKQLNVTNQFEDCNCMNSWYNKGTYELRPNNTASKDQMAQTYDNRCKTDMTKKFITNYAKNDTAKLCINPTSFENTDFSALNKSSLNFDKNCITLEGAKIEAVSQQAALKETLVKEAAAKEAAIKEAAAREAAAIAAAAAIAKAAMLPGKIESITVKASNKFVDLSWNPPPDGGLEIISYLIKKSTDLSSWDDFGSIATSFKVIDLSYNTKYYFKIQAINNAGFSPESNIINITTLGRNMLFIYIGIFIIILVIISIVFVMRRKKQPNNNDGKIKAPGGKIEAPGGKIEAPGGKIEADAGEIEADGDE